MSFKRLDQEDIVISADSITAPAWSNNKTTLISFYTSSAQVSRTSGDYYFNVYKDNFAQTASADIQFSLAYGNLNGSGSIPFNPGVTGYAPSQVVYKQFRNLINGTEETNLSFAGTTVKSVYAISVERARFKEKLLPGSLLLTLATTAGTMSLTDNSNYVTTVTYGDSGREFELVSASSGGVRVTTNNGLDGTNGYNVVSGSYGKFLPDIGVILLNGDALDLAPVSGGISLGTSTSIVSNGVNITKAFNAIDTGNNFTLRSEETVSSNYIFVRARNSEFNYSTNPSNITGSGELRHNVMIDTPQGYITSVGLYNDNNDLLGIAKLSRPLLKDFTKEALIRVKLDY
jgi:hypothetical protein